MNALEGKKAGGFGECANAAQLHTRGLIPLTALSALKWTRPLTRG
jgi:hypothetical protein